MIQTEREGEPRRRGGHVECCEVCNLRRASVLVSASFTNSAPHVYKWKEPKQPNPPQATERPPAGYWLTPTGPTREKLKYACVVINHFSKQFCDIEYLYHVTTAASSR